MLVLVHFEGRNVLRFTLSSKWLSRPIARAIVAPTLSRLDAKAEHSDFQVCFAESGVHVSLDACVSECLSDGCELVITRKQKVDIEPGQEPEPEPEQDVHWQMARQLEQEPGINAQQAERGLAAACARDDDEIDKSLGISWFVVVHR